MYFSDKIPITRSFRTLCQKQVWDGHGQQIEHLANTVLFVLRNWIRHYNWIFLSSTKLILATRMNMWRTIFVNDRIRHLPTLLLGEVSGYYFV